MIWVRKIIKRILRIQGKKRKRKKERKKKEREKEKEAYRTRDLG
jgi:hypothetical protein